MSRYHNNVHALKIKIANTYLNTTKKSLPIQMCFAQYHVQQFFSVNILYKILTNTFEIKQIFEIINYLGALTTSLLDTIVHIEIPAVIMPTEIYLSRVYFFFNIITPITIFAINEP